VPPQQRGWGDDPVLPQRTGQGKDQRGQHGPIRPRQPRTADLTTQNRDLMTKHEQLGDHRRIATRELWQPAEHPNGGEV
jgi:hypothetical protein